MYAETVGNIYIPIQYHSEDVVIEGFKQCIQGDYTHLFMSQGLEKGVDLIFLDFCPTRELLTALQRASIELGREGIARVLILDHHKDNVLKFFEKDEQFVTSHLCQELKVVDVTVKFNGDFNKSTTTFLCNTRRNVPEYDKFRAIGRRDIGELWRHHTYLADKKEMLGAVLSLDLAVAGTNLFTVGKIVFSYALVTALRTWEALHGVVGDKLARKHLRIVDNIVQKSLRIDGPIPLVACPIGHEYISCVGNGVASESYIGIGAVYSYDTAKRAIKISMRSVPEIYEGGPCALDKLKLIEDHYLCLPTFGKGFFSSIKGGGHRDACSLTIHLADGISANDPLIPYFLGQLLNCKLDEVGGASCIVTQPRGPSSTVGTV
jgi:hypothetical protein